MNNSDVQLKCTWKNCAVWGVILALAAAGVRVLAWYLLIYMGSVDIFSDYFCNMSLWTLLASLLIPEICYILSYSSYMKLAGKNPHHLREIAAGTLGKPWLAPFIGLLIAEAVWAAVSAVLVVVACELEPFAIPDDGKVFWTFMSINGIDALADLVLYFLGKQFFKPNLVQNH